MSLDLANLLTCMDLTVETPTRLLGSNLDIDYRRVYGGQLLGQSIRAVQHVAGDKALKSLHTRFPREGDTAAPMTYDIDVAHSGRTFAAVDVRSNQNGKPVSLANASLHVAEQGLEHSDPAPEVGSPQDAEPVELHLLPWEVRVVGGTDLGSRDALEATYRFWMRVDLPAEATGDQWLQQALLAHASDLTVLGTALLPIAGVSQDDTGTAFHSAVTAHTLWFHRPFDLGQWVLIDQHSPVMTRGRAYGRADVWSAQGELVASYAQEGMIRPNPTTA